MGQPLPCPSQTWPCLAPKDRAPPGPGQALAVPGVDLPATAPRENSLFSWPPAYPPTYLCGHPIPGPPWELLGNTSGPAPAPPNVHLSLVSPARPLATVGGGTSKETEGSKNGEHGTERRLSVR